MNEHVHTGFVSFVATGVMVIIFLNLWRIASAQLAASDNPTVATIGQSAGALINFGGS